MKKRKLKKSDIALIAVFVLAILFNVIARLSTTISDFYVQKIYPVISTPFIWLSGLFPFSVGEVMIVLAVLLVLIGLPVYIIFMIVKRKDKKLTSKISGFSLRFVAWIVAYVFMTETLNCFVM